MIEIKLTKRYPHSRTEDITDAYMRGWNDALDAVQNGKFHIPDYSYEADFGNRITADRKTEPSETMSCEECKHYGTHHPCELDFKACRYEPKDEPQTERSE